MPRGQKRLGMPLWRPLVEPQHRRITTETLRPLKVDVSEKNPESLPVQSGTQGDKVVSQMLWGQKWDIGLRNSRELPKALEWVTSFLFLSLSHSLSFLVLCSPEEPSHSSPFFLCISADRNLSKPLTSATVQEVLPDLSLLTLQSLSAILGLSW